MQLSDSLDRMLQVWLVRERATGDEYALKTVYLNKPDIGEAQRRMLACEADLLLALRSPHVVAAKEVVRGRSDEPWCVIMEVLRGGTVVEDLVAHDSYNEGLAAALFRQILLGVAYLHANDIIHRCALLPGSSSISEGREASMHLRVEGVGGHRSPH